MVSAPPLQRISVNEAVTKYLRNVERAVLGQSLAKTTANNYRRDLTEFTTLAEPDTILDDLTAENLDDIVLTYATKPDGRYRDDTTKTRGPGAQARFRQSISRLFSEAAAEGWVEHNPVPRMRVKPKQPTMINAARKALPQSAATALLSPPDPSETRRADMNLRLRDLFILSILVEAGPRVSELCRADRSDITVRDDGSVWLHVLGKGGKERWVPMSNRTHAAYLEYVEHERPEPSARVKKVNGEPKETVSVADAEVALLLTWRGRRITPRDVQLMVERTCKALPPDLRRRVTPHGLRHTAATLLLASGAADVNTVKEILGHASIATTGLYLDGIDHEMSQAIKAHPVTGDHSIQSRSFSSDRG